jgi:hypothetical protein
LFEGQDPRTKAPGVLVAGLRKSRSGMRPYSSSETAHGAIGKIPRIGLLLSSRPPRRQAAAGTSRPVRPHHSSKARRNVDRRADGPQPRRPCGHFAGCGGIPDSPGLRSIRETRPLGARPLRGRRPSPRHRSRRLGSPKGRASGRCGENRCQFYLYCNSFGITDGVICATVASCECCLFAWSQIVKPWESNSCTKSVTVELLSNRTDTGFLNRTDTDFLWSGKGATVEWHQVRR